MHLNFTKIFCCIPAVKCQEMLLTHTRQIISKKYYYPICIPNVDVFSQKMTAVTFIIIDRLLIIYSSYLVLGKMKKKQRTLTSFVYTILDIHIYSYTSSIHNHACRRKWGKKRILIYWEIWKRLNIRTLFTFIFNLLFMKLMSFYLPRQTMWSTRRQKSLFSLVQLHCCLVLYVWQTNTSAISFHNDNPIVLHNTNIARKRKGSSDMFT
jgi:hypothetical protein